MDLSPNDIRNYEFPSQMRGYDKESVKSFLDQVAAALEAVKQENLKLSVELDSTKNQLAGLRQFEDTIKSAAIDARRNADMTIANAKEQAAQAISKAKAEAEKILGDRARQLEEMENQISQLDLTKKSYMEKLRGLITSHLDIIDEIADAAVVQKRLESNGSDNIEVTDSEEVKTKRRETVATIPSGIEGTKFEEAEAAEEAIAATSEMPETWEQPAEEAQTDSAEIDQSDKQPPQPEADVDPELAAAIEGFRANSHMDVDQRPPKQPPRPITDPATGWVETDKRAEDVPEEFIAADSADDIDPKATGKLRVSGREPNPPAAGQQKRGIDPSNLADELDKVVSKFEEEMDKAAKN